MCLYFFLSALTICFGFELGKASTPDYAVYIMIGYIVYIVLFDIACEVHDYITKKEKKSTLFNKYFYRYITFYHNCRAFYRNTLW